MYILYIFYIGLFCTGCISNMFSLVDAFVEHKSIHLTQVKQFCKQLYHCNKSQDETEESACISVQIRGVDPVSYLHELIVHYIAARMKCGLPTPAVFIYMCSSPLLHPFPWFCKVMKFHLVILTKLFVFETSSNNPCAI